jgi:muramoyltetrapeptide carboxypeptidase
VIAANPKLLIGFSDITALHMAIAARGGFPTIHAPNAGRGWGPLSLETVPPPGLSTPLCPSTKAPGRERDRPFGTASIETLRPGRATGRLIGGNLTVVSTLMGTPFLPSFDGAILFLEDVEEAVYRIDRMLTQLAIGGQLRRVAGVVFGQCTRCARRAGRAEASPCRTCWCAICGRWGFPPSPGPRSGTSPIS